MLEIELRASHTMHKLYHSTRPVALFKISNHAAQKSLTLLNEHFYELKGSCK